MSKDTRYLGLDVHAQTISVALAEGRQKVRALGTIENQSRAVKKLLQQVGGPKGLKVCYEAGPTGYALYWELTRLGVECEVIAPSLIPKKSGDRIKTDRRDAEKLAELYRGGMLTPVWVPDAEHEALRDIVRARSAAKKDECRAKNRLKKFLLRYGLRGPANRQVWGCRWWEWLRSVQLEHEGQRVTLQDSINEVERLVERVARLDQAIDDAVEQTTDEKKAVIEALQCLRGVAKLTAVTIVVEVGTFLRFNTATQLMGYTGLVPSERSSGARTARGAVTRTGKPNLRHVLGEAAWNCRHRPHMTRRLKLQKAKVAPEIAEIAWKAQHRLHRKFHRLNYKSKPSGKVATAVARELAGFVWAIGHTVESRAQV